METNYKMDSVHTNRNVLKSYTDITTFIRENFKKLQAPSICGVLTITKIKYKDFETAKMRVLIAFISVGTTRAVSSTYIALQGLVKRFTGTDVFVDYCYIPEEGRLYNAKRSRYACNVW